MSLNIYNFSKTELIDFLKNHSEKPYRAEQIWNFLYVQGVQDFSQMHNLSNVLKQLLADNTIIKRPEIDTKQFKFSLLDKPNGAVESEVIIKKNNGNWDLSNLPDWLTADIVETDSALYAVTHKNAEINYALSYDLTKAGKQIQFAVI